MTQQILFLLFILFIALDVNAQVVNPTPQPTPPRETNGSRSNIRLVRDNSRFDQLRSLEIVQKKDELPNSNPLNELKRIIYRKPNKEETQILIPSRSLFEKYAVFLRQPNVGIVKLNGDTSCIKNSEILVVKETCLPYAFPGAGTAYSFRTESYRLPRLADLILSNGILKIDGVMQHGIMVSLGNIPLQDITLQTKELKYLIDFKPVENIDSLLKIDSKLSRGIEANGFLYRLGFYASNQTTFALRSVAYKGSYMRSVEGIVYNELDFDKRKDILVAFQVVEADPNGNITIIWKILSQGTAPVLKTK